MGMASHSLNPSPGRDENRRASARSRRWGTAKRQCWDRMTAQSSLDP